jgi:hypothetical protein
MPPMWLKIILKKKSYIYIKFISQYHNILNKKLIDIDRSIL